MSMIVPKSTIVREMALVWNRIFVRAKWVLKARCAWNSRVKHEVVAQVSMNFVHACVCLVYRCDFSRYNGDTCS